MSEKATKYDLTKKEEKEIRKLCEETTALYKFMETENLGLDWKQDTERFMAFTAVHTKNLIKHSITLTRLTYLLILLTVANIIFLFQDIICKQF